MLQMFKRLALCGFGVDVLCLKRKVLLKFLEFLPIHDLENKKLNRGELNMEQNISWDFNNKNSLCWGDIDKAEQHMPVNFSLLDLTDKDKDGALSFDEIHEFFQFANRADKNNSTEDDNGEIVTEMISFEQIKNYIAQGRLKPDSFKLGEVKNL